MLSQFIYTFLLLGAKTGGATTHYALRIKKKLKFSGLSGKENASLRNKLLEVELLMIDDLYI